MTLSSLLFHNDGPQMTIHSFRPASSSQSFAWSDFPLVRQYDTEAIAFVDQQPTQDLMSTTCCEIRQPALLSHASSMAFSSSSSSSSASISSSMEPPTTKPQKKSVSFAPALEVCEYSIVVAKHPFCRDPLGLSLGWEHTEPMQYDLDQYEKDRSAYRRQGDHLRLNYWERKNLLKRVGGYTEADFRNFNIFNQSHPTSMDLRYVE